MNGEIRTDDDQAGVPDVHEQGGVAAEGQELCRQPILPGPAPHTSDGHRRALREIDDGQTLLGPVRDEHDARRQLA